MSATRVHSIVHRSMSVQILDVDCPACGIKCWLNNGDVEDLTVPDVEAARCWHCRHEFILDPESDEPIEMLLIDDSYQSASQAAG